MRDTRPTAALDRPGLLRRILRTEEYVLEGKRRIHDQQLKIHRLELRGHETKYASERLRDLQKTQAQYEENGRTLLDELKK